MIPTQPKKWPRVLVTVALVVFVIKDPETAAAAVQTVAAALGEFVSAF